MATAAATQRVIGSRHMHATVKTCPLTGTPFTAVSEAIARGEHKREDGSTWEGLADGKGVKLPSGYHRADFSRSPAERFEFLRGQVDRLMACDFGVTTTLLAELSRFEADYPMLGPRVRQALKIDGPEDPFAGGLFETGPVQISRLARVSEFVTDAELAVLIRRHVAGDFGTHGKVADAKLTEDSRFAPGLFDGATRNAVAIEAGSGLVVSQFGIAPADGHEARGPGWRRDQTSTVTLVTLVAPGHARSLAFCDRDGLHVA